MANEDNKIVEVKEINQDIADLLSEIFSDTEAHYKISVSVEIGNNVTIKYDDMDEDWCDDLLELCRLLTKRATDAEDSAASQAVSNAGNLSNSDGSAVPARRS